MVTSVKDMLEPTGRLRFADIRGFAKTVNHSIFQHQFTHPILVGAALLQGAMKHQNAATAGTTMSFDLEALAAHASAKQSDPSGLQRAIYPLLKQDLSISPSHVFTVGRDNQNDLVLVDYTISRTHAQIKLENGRYFVTDQGSTNGTVMDGTRLTPQKDYPFNAKNEVRFGRFSFIVMTATDLYVHLRAL